MKGSAAPPRRSRQEATGCIVDASSWSPSGKDSAARQHRHVQERLQARLKIKQARTLTKVALFKGLEAGAIDAVLGAMRYD